jgi:hypothetical protein
VKVPPVRISGKCRRHREPLGTGGMGQHGTEFGPIRRCEPLWNISTRRRSNISKCFTPTPRCWAVRMAFDLSWNFSALARCCSGPTRPWTQVATLNLFLRRSPMLRQRRPTRLCGPLFLQETRNAFCASAEALASLRRYAHVILWPTD